MHYSIKNSRFLRKNLTKAEKELWKQLRCKKIQGLRFHRQVVLGIYIVDFACFDPKIVIELDGSQHGEEEAIVYDRKRTHYLESIGYRVLRFWNGEVLREMEKVKNVIWDFCFLTTPSFPSP